MLDELRDTYIIVPSTLRLAKCVFYSGCSSSTLHVEVIPYKPHAGCIWNHNTFWSPKTKAKRLCCLQGIKNEESIFSKNMWMKIKCPNRHNLRSNDTSIQVAKRQWIANSTVHCVSQQKLRNWNICSTVYVHSKGRVAQRQIGQNNDGTLIVTSRLQQCC